MFNFFKKKFKDESIEDQIKDLERFPDFLSKESINGLDCNVLPNAKGEFGKVATNPVPVNGPIGEIKYLNRLRTDEGGLIFHRLGSDGNIDIYEVVSCGGNVWDILYLDMYHPRRSINIPEGYVFSDFHEIFSRSLIGYGVNSFDSDFPFGLSKPIEDQIGGTLGVRIAKKYEEIVVDRSKFVRPFDHIEKIKKVKLAGNFT